MTALFASLFSPIKIGTKTARNRIVFPAHGVPALPFMGDEADGNEYIEYQAARARGGCALTIIGNIGISYPSPAANRIMWSVPARY